MNITPIEFARRRFVELNEYYGKQGIPPQTSFLRIEEKLVGGKGNYQFNLQKENLSELERGLDRNDLFVVLGASIYLRIEDKDRDGVLPPHFFAKKGRVTITPATVSDPAVYTLDEYGFLTDDINALYNGNLLIQTGTVVNFQAIPTALFKKQSAGIVGTQANYVKDVNNAFDLQDSLYVLPERLSLAGTQNHKIQLSFPSFNGSDYSAAQAGNGTSTSDDTIIPTTHYETKVGLYMLGYLVPGGTDDRFRKAENPFSDVI